MKFSTIVADPPWDWGDEGDQSQLGRARAIGMYEEQAKERQHAEHGTEIEQMKAEAKDRQKKHGGTAPGRKNTSGNNSLSVSDQRRVRTQRARAAGTNPRYIDGSE